MKATISRVFSRVLTGVARRNSMRWWHGLPRRCTRRAAIVHYFHQDDDPYSELLAGVLPQLQERYRIDLHCHRVAPPDDASAPDRERLRDWSIRDAAALQLAYQLKSDSRAIERLQWHTPNPQAGAILRQRLGHYLGATIYFEGEWYWGIDRLHYLEKRLQSAGLAQRPVETLLIEPQALRFTPIDHPNATRPILEFFCSLRSPYTYLAIERTKRLADHYGADLQLRFVLPMVMRGLPVGFAKRKYILLDTKREAERLEMPFGNVVDPVGKPVEDGLAILHRAIARGRGIEFLSSFLSGAFAEGIDTHRPQALRGIALRAGLTDSDLEDAPNDPAWRTMAAVNREALLASGLWGVPSFRVVGYPSVWGQDRLWMIERDLLAATRT
jgi:2-hydroxychromene-2-carboxylate isomerase